MTMHTFSTERLHLSPITLADAPFILALLNSPRWLEFIGDRGVNTLADAEAYIENRILPAMEQEGIVSWKVTLKSNGETIGNCGFYQRDFLDIPDLGFALLPEYIGKGYGFEAASGSMTYGIEHFGVKSCCAITSPENVASIGLLKKLDFKEIGLTKWPDDEEALLLFEWDL
ncbi:MAG: GNAT family N-acetyltransferase [Bacteroidota bacterium]